MQTCSAIKMRIKKVWAVRSSTSSVSPTPCRLSQHLPLSWCLLALSLSPLDHEGFRQGAVGILPPWWSSRQTESIAEQTLSPPLRNEWASEEKEGVGRLAQAASCLLPQNQSPDWHNLRLAFSCPGSKSLWQLCHLRNRTEFPLSSSGCPGGSIPMTLGQGVGDMPELPLAPYTHHSLQSSQVSHIRVENSH